MTPAIVWEFVKSFCVLFFLTYLFSRLDIVKKHLKMQPGSMREKIMLSLLFGLLGCVGSSIGIEFMDSLINTRVIGVAVGGLLGGPLVGILSGTIAALHRVFFVKAGLATAVVCGISMVLEGTFAGFVSAYAHRSKKFRLTAALTVVACELFRKFMLLLFIRPFDFAVQLVADMTAPMIAINSLGVVFFIAFIENVEHEQEQLRTRQSEIVLAITDKVAACFRQGLIGGNLRNVVHMIEENTDFTHILITDMVSPIVSNLPGDAWPVSECSVRELEEKAGAGKSCFEFARNGVRFVGVTLFDDTETAGFLLLGKNRAPSLYDCRLAEGLGRLFSSQLTIGNLEYRSSLLKEAEIRVLQTQTSPHFLFNTLTVISSLCRTDAQKARQVIDYLADFYRKNLRVNSRFVPLQDEIEHIEAYLGIIRARYASKIDIQYDIDRELECYLPPLSLQPLVENSVKHGLLPLKEGGLISVRARREVERNAVKIEVEDNGKGFDLNRPGADDSNHVGLNNVRRRLLNCFGDDLIWKIDTKPDAGTRITIVVPALSHA